jgi:hypothetical protein
MWPRAVQQPLSTVLELINAACGVVIRVDNAECGGVIHVDNAACGGVIHVENAAQTNHVEKPVASRGLQHNYRDLIINNHSSGQPSPCFVAAQLQVHTDSQYRLPPCKGCRQEHRCTTKSAYECQFLPVMACIHGQQQ